ncbi:Copper chaperone CopZ [Flavobacteriaceae bacterium MAR_2010_188]|nr:Copper chaperone CopZ [Flavobacteriaceae bacterium MAR_2010_188]
MKKTIITTVLIAFIGIFSINAQGMDKYQVKVDGLGCPFCAYGLEKKFKEFKGIKNVKIEIETGDFTFDYPADKALSIEDVENQVEKAGYTPMTTKIVRADGKIEASGEMEVVADNAELASKAVYVYGNCGMCEARITKAARTIPGVASATWDEDTKMLAVNYDVSKTSLSEIEMAVAKVGHDTKNNAAANATYYNLPACCKYERANQ